MQIRTRFAPSPTGFLHIGGVRTAMYCYALANKAKNTNGDGGSFIIRIEDTDQNRYVEAGVQEIYTALELYGLIGDESDIAGGDFGPYVQSKRLARYQEIAKILVEKGAAYYCFLKPEAEEEVRKIYAAERKPFRSPHRDLTPVEVESRLAAGEKYVIRQRLPQNMEVDYEDGLQGKMRFNTNDIDEGVLLKTADEDGQQFPTYHLAMLVDDHEMQISHVFRGVEWMPSTPKHVLLYQAMGWSMPQIFHLSLILDPEGGKLSKRKGATAAVEFIKEGYLSQAVLNFLMMLGWSSPLPREYGQAERELYTLSEFVELFDVKDLNKASPVFNREKLEWYSQQYISKLSGAEFELALKKYFKVLDWVNIRPELLDEIFGFLYRKPGESSEKTKDLLRAVISDSKLSEKLELIKTRVKSLSEIPQMLQFFYQKPVADLQNDKIKHIPADLLPTIVSELVELHQSLGADTTLWTQESWETAMRALADKHGLKHGDLFMILRLVVVGSPFSPPLRESLQLLGAPEVLSRIASAA